MRLPHRLRSLGRIWRKEIREVGNEARMLSAVAFLVTFALTRVVTHFLLAAKGGGGGIEVGPLHLHHMVFGLVLILASGIPRHERRPGAHARGHFRAGSRRRSWACVLLLTSL